MFTKTENKTTGIITGFRTQQYEIGTYLIINDDPSKQMGIDATEKEFHKELRTDKNLRILEQY